jgi:hypothetical protein
MLKSRRPRIDGKDGPERIDEMEQLFACRCPSQQYLSMKVDMTIWRRWQPPFRLWRALVQVVALDYYKLYLWILDHAIKCFASCGGVFRLQETGYDATRVRSHRESASRKAPCDRRGPQRRTGVKV